MAPILIQRSPDAPFETMDEAQLEKREGVTDNAHELTTWVEYWLDGVCVHRSVHVTLKEGLNIFGEQSELS